jgi:hypothetical protein
MRTKVTTWGNIETGQVFYGIKAFVDKWYNVAEDGVALLFETREAVEAKRKELRKIQPTTETFKVVQPA